MDDCKRLFRYIIVSFIISFLLASCKTAKQDKVLTGADVLLSEKFDLIKNKKIGIITNHTSILANGIHLVDTLFSRDDVEIVKLFSPEHGIRGDAPDGKSINDSLDIKTGLPIQSLYGTFKKPTSNMLTNIDLLLFDIQDIGARFYTFTSTMYYAIQAAAENNIPILVLDRPNPINGNSVDGPMLDTAFASFVGLVELPIQHGMTIGELAKYFNQPKILKTAKAANLTVVKMKNWRRSFYFENCNLKWLKPSPNMPNMETAFIYPGLCLIEGTNISEGRGTYSPFRLIGSPYIISKEVISELENFGLEGVELIDTTFTPRDIPKMAASPKYENELCNGILINVTNRNKFKPIDFSVKIISTFHKLYPSKFSFRAGAIDRLWGSNKLRESILKGKDPEDIITDYQNQLNKFIEYRKQFLLY